MYVEPMQNLPNSFTMLTRDVRGTGRFFIALFATLGSLIIPKGQKKQCVLKNVNIVRLHYKWNNHWSQYDSNPLLDHYNVNPLWL